MGVLGSLLTDAVGGTSHSTVDKFMSKFNNSAQHFVDQIDTLNSFDCEFEFYPGDSEQKENKKGFEDKMVGMMNNAIGNLTGGLVDMSSGGDRVDVSKGLKGAGKVTFMQYLLEQNLIEVSKGPNYKMDISYYIQNIQTPNVNIITGEGLKSPVGNFTITGDIVTPQSNTLNMEILNTKAPLIERIFYPWMKEVSLPLWSYASQPYTTADITVSMKKHADIKYIFVGARPTNLDTYNPSQELNGTPTRNVTFTFDYMFISSDLKTKESAKNKLRSLATGVVGDVASTFGL